MHEMSIVMSILDTVENERVRQEADEVESIELDIGVLSGVEMEAFYFAWEAGVKKTRLEKTSLRVNRPEAKAKCTDCGKFFVARNSFDPCPHCGNPFCEIISGKELKVKRIVFLKN